MTGMTEGYRFRCADFDWDTKDCCTDCHANLHDDPPEMLPLDRRYVYVCCGVWLKFRGEGEG